MRSLVLFLGLVLITVKCLGQNSHHYGEYQYWKPEDSQYVVERRQFSPNPPLRRQAAAAFTSALPAILFTIAGTIASFAYSASQATALGNRVGDTNRQLETTNNRVSAFVSSATSTHQSQGMSIKTNTANIGTTCQLLKNILGETALGTVEVPTSSQPIQLPALIAHINVALKTLTDKIDAIVTDTATASLPC